MVFMFLFCVGALLLQQKWQRVDYEWSSGKNMYQGVIVDVPQEKAKTYIIRKSKFPQNPKRSVRFSGKRTKRSVQKRKARNTQKAETKVL
ncbi:hypothetical protein, partial [Phocaeicola coprocola]|uniref:hypothetical protein n=1 Tax=Phocaeicola coprocola TaxID=310298 RepID=UPI003A94417A